MIALTAFVVSTAAALAGDGVTCKMGDLEFNSFVDAILNAPQDKTPVTITMLADEDAEYPVGAFHIKRNSNITIDLNGKHIHTNGKWDYIEVDYGATLTMTDSGNDGRWTFTGCHMVTNQGTLIIKGGTYEDLYGDYTHTVGLIDNGHNLTIDGGHFIQRANVPIIYCLDNSQTEINNGTFENIGEADPDNWDNKHAVATVGTSDATLVINDGMFRTEGNTKLICCGCSTEINGGEFHSGSMPYAYTIDNLPGNPKPVIINGGKFYGEGNNCTIYNRSTTGTNLRTYGGYFENQNGYPIIMALPNTRTVIIGGEFNMTTDPFGEPILCSEGTMSVTYGLFSKYPLTIARSTTYGFIEANTDQATAGKYPYRGAYLDFELEDIKEVWLKNVSSGQYVGIGDNSYNGNQFKGSDAGMRFFMYKLKDNHVVFTTMIGSSHSIYSRPDGVAILGNCFGPAREGNYHDKVMTFEANSDHWGNLGPAFAHTLAQLIEIEPNVFAIKFVGNNYLWQDSADDIIYSDLAFDPDCPGREYLWKIETRNDIINAMKNAEDTVNVSSLVFSADFAAKDFNFEGAALYVDENHMINVSDTPVWQGITADVKHTEYTAKDGKHKSGLMEVSAKKFDVFQTINGLPDGEYIVQCNGFYRNGLSALSVASKRDKGTEELNAIFYANDVEQPLKSLLDDAVVEKVDGLSSSKYGYVPKDAASALMQFGQGLYVNRIKVKVTDGTLTFGVKMQEKITSGEWTVFDNFRLYYCGNKQEGAMADVNADGMVDTQDVLNVYDFIQYGVMPTREDVNQDGTVDTQDVLMIYDYMISNAKVRKDIEE